MRQNQKKNTERKYNYITTKNSKEDIEFMLSWLSNIIGKRKLSDEDKQVEEEIRNCIRDTFEELPKNQH